METHFLTWTRNSRFCSKTTSRTIAGSTPSSRTLDCAQDGPSIMLFRPLKTENEEFFWFHGGHVFCGVKNAHMHRYLHESFIAETIG